MHTLAWIHVVWAILCEGPLRGLTPRAEIEKSQKVMQGSHRNDVSPLSQGLRYRAACDNILIFPVYEYLQIANVFFVEFCQLYLLCL